MLPGIGDIKARSIITYRQEHGPFIQPEDLLNVPGIGQGILSSIKELIILSDNPK
jgi:competence protein ComEA